MFQNNSIILPKVNHNIVMYQSENERDIPGSPLTVGIDTIMNTSEDKTNITSPFIQDEQQKPPVKSGWIKGLLISGATLAGVSGLCYMLQRVDMGYSSEKLSTPDPIRPSNVEVSFTWGLSEMESHSLDDTDQVKETTRSPYPYYKNIYGRHIPKGSKNLPNGVAHISSLNMPNPPSIINQGTTEQVDPLFDKPQFTTFILQNINPLVRKSYVAEPKYKCELLGEVINKLFYYKEIDSTLRSFNSEKDRLTAEEQELEVMIRRKLTAFYLAAETIINGKGRESFYINVLNDHRDYSGDELITRENYIMDYYDRNNQVGRC